MQGFRFIGHAVLAEFAAVKPQLILLVPVMMAIGIGVYFTLSFEPFLYAGVIALLVIIPLLFFAKNIWRIMVLGVFLIVLGFSAAQWRAHLSYTPLLSKKIEFAKAEGRIESIEDLEKGVRVVLKDLIIEDFDPKDTPRKIRVKIWKGHDLRVGQRVRVLAGLNPPSSPVLPRGFDFARYMYFQGIGGVGFTYDTPEILSDGSAGIGHGVIENLRNTIADRIQNSLDPPAAGVAMALMIGQRKAISDSDIEAIRASGLAHMLAISGLHIGLFSGVIFFAVRLLMASFPGLALRHPIKKYAAVIAILGAFFYMLIAGASIPSQRAMITVAIIFGAMLIDRSAISLRVVACAAFVILMFFPESLTSVSFQMSFAAVTALVAFYDWLRPWWSKWHRQAGFWRRVALYFAGISLTTTIATFATAPFTLFHFQTLASYGLLANFICVPVLGAIIMPLAVLALVLMPLGLEGLPLILMEPALMVMLEVAHFVTDLDGSVIRLPQLPFLLLLLAVFMALSVIILRERLRGICVVALGFFFLMNSQIKQADILISSKFELVAFHGDEPYLHVSDRRKDAFARENWERAMGFEIGSAQSFPREGRVEVEEFTLNCGEQGCRAEKAGYRVSYLRINTPDIINEECAWADIVIARYDFEDCMREGVISLNKWDGYWHGSHAIYLDDNIRIDRAEDFRGDRPWVQ